MLQIPSPFAWFGAARSRKPDARPGDRGQTPQRAGATAGMLHLGHVLCHCDTFGGLTGADLFDGTDGLVLLDLRGSLLMQLPHARIRAIECGPATDLACRDRRVSQSEEHLFIRYDDEQGTPSHLEISVGALDDVGPLRQMCECLRTRTGLGPPDA